MHCHSHHRGATCNIEGFRSSTGKVVPDLVTTTDTSKNKLFPHHMQLGRRKQIRDLLTRGSAVQHQSQRGCTFRKAFSSGRKFILKGTRSRQLCSPSGMASNSANLIDRLMTYVCMRIVNINVDQSQIQSRLQPCSTHPIANKETSRQGPGHSLDSRTASSIGDPGVSASLLM